MQLRAPLLALFMTLAHSVASRIERRDFRRRVGRYGASALARRRSGQLLRDDAMNQPAPFPTITICRRRSRLLFASALLIFAAALAAWTAPASAGTGWSSTDFLVTDFCNSSCSSSKGILVYDANFSFRGYLDANLVGAHSLDFTSDGRIVALGIPPNAQNHVVRIYDNTGTQVGGFSNPNVGSNVSGVIRVGPSDHLFIAAQYEGNGIKELDLSGNLLRVIGTDQQYTEVAFTPANDLWALRFNATAIDIFDVPTGTRTSTFVGDNGQPYVTRARASAGTNTMLSADYGPLGFERLPDGSYLRTFSDNMGGSQLVGGVTRGPGGDIFVALLQSPSLARWKSGGSWVGVVSLSGLNYTPYDVLWAGNWVPPHQPPSLSGPDGVDCVLPGSPISFQESATDPEGTLTTLSATSLPAGASFPAVSAIATVTGSFNWTPGGADIGNHTITFSASDSGSPILTTTKNVNISVVSSSPITSHPQPQSICAGQTATFSTSATATGYQWQSSIDGISWTDITGATSSSYTTSPQYSGGYYRCIVTATCGPIATNAARLTITPLPASPGNSLRATKNSPSSVHLNWASCTAASSYRILRCAASSAPCSPSLLGTTGAISIDDTTASGAVLWYAVESANACGVTP